MSLSSNVTIVRWRGGEGGDTLLKMIIGSNKNFSSNIQWKNVDDNGKTRVVENNIEKNFIGLPSAVNIAIGGKCNNVIVEELTGDVAKLQLLPNPCILKSHWYKSSILNDITVDLVFSIEMLPFVVGALVEKNTNHLGNYSNIRSKIKDPSLRKAYDLYSVSWDRLHHHVEYSSNQIGVESLLGSWDLLTSKLAEFNLILNDTFQPYHAKWLSKNQSYMPTTQYKKLIADGNFDYTDPHISLTEKYCLLAMAKKKFTVLN